MKVAAIWCFRAVVLSSVVFLVTVFLMVASAFTPQDSPLAQALNQHCMSIMAAEVGAVLVTGFFAMTLDRHRKPVTPEDESSSPRGRVGGDSA